MTPILADRARGGRLALLGLAGALACALAGTSATGAGAPAGERRPAPLPGAQAAPPELALRLWRAYQALGPDYRPRTEHLEADGSPRYVNRLILEDSPYLIQHAHNPVDWYPWGAEAFDRARREGKPVFLSIGYSTCHWCHVMERESFEDEEVARRLNEGFVSIKVDREQRPDVDEVYMTAVELTTGRGGWPMSSLLTSDGKPFFGGTYLPRAAFLDLLAQASAAWRDRRPELAAHADQVTAAVGRVTAAAGAAAAIDDGLLETAVDELLERHDPRLGGFSPAPKFPHEPELLFLLERALRTGDDRALVAVETTLDRMARGGLYDQVGGGFHRYSTDERWRVPHFEKMLYNQAHLARVYLEAARLTGDRLFERVARQTLDYVLRDLASPAGAFYSATDADSEGAEGRFFVWTPAELAAALPAPDAELALRLFGVGDAGNFEGGSILLLPEPLPALAAELELPLDRLLERVDGIRARLYDVRERRVHPLRDEKILTEWNAAMVTTLARAGELLGAPRYLDAARRAAEFLWRHNRREDGRLWRVHLDGSSSIEAAQSDYAYLIEAFVALYDVTAETLWLERASALADVLSSRFWDASGGGFFMGAEEVQGVLPARPKSPADGATPSGNAVAVRALAQLAARTGEAAHARRAQETLAAFSGQIRRQPTAFAYMLLGADELASGAAGPRAFGAGGALRAEAAWAPDPGERRAIEVTLNLAPGWHVNSNRPLDESLVPTRLAVAAGGAGLALGAVDWPPAERVTLGFQSEPLAVYTGRVTLRAATTLDRADPPLVARLALTLQACDDQKCLRPEELRLELPLARLR